MDRSERHKPNRLLNYLQVHETVLGSFLYREVVSEDALEFFAADEGQFFFVGHLLLRAGRLKLTVAKRLEIVSDTDDPGDPEVQTVSSTTSASSVTGTCSVIARPIRAISRLSTTDSTTDTSTIL